MINEEKTSQEQTYSQFEDMTYAKTMSKTARYKRRGWRLGDSLDAFGWAVFFIWGALVVAANITDFSESYNWWDGWGVFFTGVAAIVLVGTAIRWLVPKYRRAGLIWGLVFGLILLGIGLGDIAVWIWPLLLGAIGISILYRLFVRRR
ncbi:MAG: hypothetical protein JSV77_05635 [Dehalococcoidales bacterium]|nr:MAG: hypothetical protein JSV77_05635 [Dehalococcoidales bacterium]